MAGLPMDQRDGWIWFDGELKPWKDVKVHVLTHGLHYASSVFEGARAYGGHIYALSAHSQRLRDSAELMGFPLRLQIARAFVAPRLALRWGLIEA